MPTKSALYRNLTTDETDPQVISVYDETTTPSNTANQARIYAKDVAGVSKMHALDSDGTEIELGSGGGGTIQTLTSSSNQVAIDSSLGTQFKLNDLAEDTEIQIPSNGTDGDEILITLENTGGQVVTFAAGWVAVSPNNVSTEAGRVSVIAATARDYGSGLEWAYGVTHAETVIGILDIDETITTPNATPVNIAVIATSTDDRLYLLDLSFGASDKTADEVYQRGIRVCVYRDGGSVLTIKDFNSYSLYAEDGTWDTNVSVSGQNILVPVTGDASNSVDWRVKGIVKEV